MTQSRYLDAFLLSSLTFLLFYFIFLSFTDIKKIVKPAHSQVIKIALITPIKKMVKSPVAKAKPQIVPTPMITPVIIKKIVKKKIIKKVKPKKAKPKKIIKKKIFKKTIVKKRVIKKPKETYPPISPPVHIAPKPILRPVLKATPASQKIVKSNYHKKAFLRNVRSKIIANKIYPKIAQRRHIEGSVKVRFDITKHGKVSNIRFINGKRIFQKSIQETLARTFPMGIPLNVKGELPITDISVILHFNIR